METMLEGLENSVGQLRVEKLNKIRVNMVTRRWNDAKGKYSQYKTQVSWSMFQIKCTFWLTR